MGYRGKLVERDQARVLRAEGKTLVDIAAALQVSKSSVSGWVRDVAFTPSPRRTGARRRPHPQHEAKLAQIAALDDEGAARVGVLSEQAFLVAGAALYAGEGAKTDRRVAFANSDARLVAFFLAWLRHFSSVDESRLRFRLYLHEGLNLEAATQFWVQITGIPPQQHHRAYRPIADASIRTTKHENGCATVQYSSSSVHRQVMGVVRALLSSSAVLPG